MSFDTFSFINVSSDDLERLKYPEPSNKLILKVLNGDEDIERLPVWIMRQAGRYLPEFRKLREKYSFFELCSSPELCCEVTMMPINRFNLDAAIIFSDILVLSNFLGVKFEMKPGEGPRAEFPLDSFDKIENIRIDLTKVRESLDFVYKSINLTRIKLANKVPLIGFAAAPWTLAAYMICGSGQNKFKEAKEMFIANSDKMLSFLEKLASVITAHLFFQSLNGCQILQIFDSHTGVLDDQPKLLQFIINLNMEIVKSLKRNFKIYDMDIKIILFAGNCPEKAYEQLNKSDFDCISIFYGNDVKLARKMLPGKVLQGNLDPKLLLAGTDIKLLTDEREKMVKEFGKSKYIVNLGHGIQKESDPKLVEHFIKLIHSK